MTDNIQLKYKIFPKIKLIIKTWKLNNTVACKYLKKLNIIIHNIYFKNILYSNNNFV